MESTGATVTENEGRNALVRSCDGLKKVEDGTANFTFAPTNLLPRESVPVVEYPDQNSVGILMTGGTITAVAKTSNESALSQPTVEEMKRIFEDLSGKKLADVSKYEVSTLTPIDSSNLDIGRIMIYIDYIRSKMETHRSFVIPHGTDTLAYTAAALHIAFGTRVRIILTGSQRNSDTAGSDAARNFNNALLMADDDRLGDGVWTVFGKSFLKGSTTMKLSSCDEYAFECHQDNPGIIDYATSFPRNHPNIEKRDPLSDDEVKFAKNVQSVVLNPTMEEFPKFSECSGLVIRCYGIGNVTENHNIQRDIKELAKKIPIVLTTQCAKGGISEKPMYKGVGLESEEIIRSGLLSFEMCIMLLSNCIARVPIDADNRIMKIKKLFLDKAPTSSN